MYICHLRVAMHLSDTHELWTQPGSFLPVTEAGDGRVTTDDLSVRASILEAQGLPSGTHSFQESWDNSKRQAYGVFAVFQVLY